MGLSPRYLSFLNQEVIKYYGAAFEFGTFYAKICGQNQLGQFKVSRLNMATINYGIRSRTNNQQFNHQLNENRELREREIYEDVTKFDLGEESVD